MKTVKWQRAVNMSLPLVAALVGVIATTGAIPPAACAGEIHDLVRQGDAAQIEAFIGAHPELVNAPDDRSCTPLHFAVNRGDTELVGFLLANGADLAARDADGDSPLHWAALYAKTEIADLLISRGADINAVNGNGQGVLQYALRGRASQAIVDRLLDAGLAVELPPDGGGPTVLDAASAGCGRLLELLLGQGADRGYVNRRGETLLHRAAQGGLADIVEAEIARGVEVDARMFNGQTPLAAAASAGRRGMVESLIARGANVQASDNYDGTMLHCAAESGSPETIAYLLEKGLDVNARDHWGGTAIASVAQISGNGQAFDLLISKGANPNLRDNTGETAFTWAAITGRGEIVKSCWESLSAEQRREFGPQALSRAAANGRNEIVEYLLVEGVDVNSHLWNGRTALVAAAAGGKVETVRSLLAHGARHDIADEMGRTPLAEAAMLGSADLMGVLLAAGADVNRVDNDGNSPLFLARAYGRNAAAGYLEAKGGLAAKTAPDVLATELEQGEALVWYLGHSSWVIKTSGHFLVFDYTGRGGRGADAPGLSNGNIVPEEIAEEDVLVFTSHAHGDHYSPVIYGWKSMLPKVRYFFGWDLDTPFEAHKFGEPRSKLELADVKVYTIYDHHETVPEVAYLVRLDGLDIFFSGDYLGRYEEDFPYLKTLTDGVDMAFCGCGGKIHAAAANELRARCYFPMHAWPFMYEGFAHFGTGVETARIMPATHAGDRFLYKDGEITQLYAKVKPNGGN